MPLHLKRYQQEGDDHFITFSTIAPRNTPASRFSVSRDDQALRYAQTDS
jgi:hypothetical protein